MEESNDNTIAKRGKTMLTANEQKVKAALWDILVMASKPCIELEYIRQKCREAMVLLPDGDSDDGTKDDNPQKAWNNAELRKTLEDILDEATTQYEIKDAPWLLRLGRERKGERNVHL